MTIFAGYYDCAPGPAGSAGLLANLTALLKSAGAASVEIRRSGRLHLVWHDDEAYPDPGFSEYPNGLCLLAGDPIHAAAPRARDRQAAVLHSGLADPEAALRDCAGTFALLHHQTVQDRLLLATDPMGSRTVYYASHGGRLYFSSCLSVLEGLEALPKTVSAYLLFEHLTFTYNLDGRTPYREIRLLRQGEYLTASREDWTVHSYHRWDRLPPVELDYPARVKRTYELFMQAVERRSWRSSSAIAMLSGGLDSRLNAGALHQLGKRVIALNCSPTAIRIQDATYAERLAAALQFDFVQVPIPPGPVNWGVLTRRGLDQAAQIPDRDHARLVFSGEGGSVGLGLLHYYPETCGLLREGRLAQVLERHLQPMPRLPSRYLQRDAQALASARIRERASSLVREIEVDPERQFHLFLMQNNQRCHLHSFYEEIAFHRHELLTPFQDAGLLRFILACPIEDFAGHRLYHDMLPYFPPELSKVPWQVYPEHLPCPVVDTETTASQFSGQGRVELRAAINTSIRPSIGLALGGHFPSPPFRRLPVLAVSLLSAVSGTDRFNYVHRAVQTSTRFLRQARGGLHWDL